MLKKWLLGVFSCVCITPLTAAPITAGPYSVEFGQSDFVNGVLVRELLFNGPDGVKTFGVPIFDILTERYLGDRGILVSSGEILGDPVAYVVDYAAPPCLPCDMSNLFTLGSVGRLAFRLFDVPPDTYPWGIEGSDTIPHQYVPKMYDQPSDFGSDENGMLTGMLHGTYGGFYGAPHKSFAYTWDIQVNNVPEPASVGLIGAGLAAMFALGRRRVLRRIP